MPRFGKAFLLASLLPLHGCNTTTVATILAAPFEPSHAEREAKNALRETRRAEQRNARAEQDRERAQRLAPLLCYSPELLQINPARRNYACAAADATVGGVYCHFRGRKVTLTKIHGEEADCPRARPLVVEVEPWIPSSQGQD